MLELHRERGIYPFHSKGMKTYAPYKLVLVWNKFQLTGNFCHHTLVWWERIVRFQGRATLGVDRSSALGASARTLHRGTGAADCAQSFPVSPFLTPEGEHFHGEVDGHHGFLCSATLLFPMNLSAQNLQAVRACVCPGIMPVNVNGVEMRIQGNTRNTPYTP